MSLIPSHHDMYEEVVASHQRIGSYIRRTPINLSTYLSDITRTNVYLKLEHLQYTGSFKLRGATNKLLQLKSKAQIYTASTGNHGKAVCWISQRIGVKAKIFVPKNTDQAKLSGIERLGGDIVYAGKDCAVTELTARTQAAKDGIPYISPYNDLQIIQGQGTLGYEIHEQLNSSGIRPDAVIISVGGGGLIAGVASYLKYVYPSLIIFGAQPKNSPVMSQSIKAGQILMDIESQDTLSDGTAGGIEKGTITFPLCQQYVDEWIICDEDEIKQAFLILIEHEHMIVEGAAALALAALLKLDTKKQGTGIQYKKQLLKNVVVVLCGNNIQYSKLKNVMASSL